MGRYLFRLPDVGEGVVEAEIVAWHAKIGDIVSEDQNLVDVMTDKAIVEITSPVEGIVVALHGEAGTTLPVGSVLIELGVEGAGNTTNATIPTAEPPPATFATIPEAPLRSNPDDPKAFIMSAGRQTESGKAAFATRPQGEASLAAPASRRRAYELGIPLQYVPGTGPGGRITSEDLDTYIANGGTRQRTVDLRYAERDRVSDKPIIGLRRKIAEKMQEAKRRIPHINYVEEVDVTELEALRQDLNTHRRDDRPKLTILPFIMRAMVRVLPEFPQINARFDDDQGVLHAYEEINIGIATQTPKGLMVPVVRHAEARDLWDLAAELTRVSRAARDGSASLQEMGGSTITITSLGTLGGISSTPVINYPEVAILAPNKISDRPIVQSNFITIRKMMNLSSAFDHRIVDGFDGASFIRQMKRLLEHPALVFMD